MSKDVSIRLQRGHESWEVAIDDQVCMFAPDPDWAAYMAVAYRARAKSKLPIEIGKDATLDMIEKAEREMKIIFAHAGP